MDASMQVLEIALEVLLVIRPAQAIYARCGIFLKVEERLVEQIDTDVVEERGELLLLPLPCCLPYACQRQSRVSLFDIVSQDKAPEMSSGLTG
jgi:hypothetical protein